jgi:D-beta-D-heptose 7-phosphate kinase / D-beta-D-heptose 1-phosphate adenosyltransferase
VGVLAGACSLIKDLQHVLNLMETGWSGMRILVVGDVMLDKYVWGDVKRVSPEAPVPLISASHHTTQLGGAANVAANLTGLGVNTVLAGFVGDDQDRTNLQQLLSGAGVEAKLIETPGLPTTSKTRMIGGHQQMLRVDIETTEQRPAPAYEALLQVVTRLVDGVDAVVLSDYAKGVLIAPVCRQLIDKARSRRISIFVGPKGQDFERYANASIVCPNLQELATALHIPADEIRALFSRAQAQIASLGLAYFVVTMGERGIAVLKSDSVLQVPARARRVFDVSGAGDTVLAVIAAASSAGLDIQSASELANVAAGLVVEKVGTVPIDRRELTGELSVSELLLAKDKILDRSQLLARIAAWKANGDTIVFTNGCFDILHVGHLTLLEAARREGTRLVVAINSDLSVRRLKGASRPIVGEMDRARLLAGLTAVDAVTVFEEDTPLECILQLRPNVLVKGGDYTERQVVGQHEVKSWNGRVQIVPIANGVSTTSLIAQMAAVLDG